MTGGYTCSFLSVMSAREEPRTNPFNRDRNGISRSVASHHVDRE